MFVLIIVLTINDNILHAFIFSYQLLHVLNFDPVRRRMSVLVKANTGTVYILLLIKMSVYLFIIMSKSAVTVFHRWVMDGKKGH